MEQIKTELLVLLNSDTEVPPRWLERLILPLQRDASIASVTPFSNAATICSFPIALKDNPLYLGLSIEQIDQAFNGVGSTAPPIDIPTGVGFCMAMRKSVIDQIGAFDPIYGRGYGEENDWCMRAAARGHRHVLVANVFVYHKHGGSFQSEERERLINGNLQVLKARYPKYHELVEAHIQADPAKALREFIKLRLFAEVTGGVTLVVDHGLGGGANAFRSDVVKSVVDMGKAAIVLICDARDGEQYQMIVYGSEGETRFSLSSGEMLVEFLQSIRVADVLYNNLVGAADPLALIRRLGALVQAKSWPLRIMVHDFYPICPSYTLIDQAGSYCGVPDRLETCERCMQEMPPELLPYRPPNLEMRAWRMEWQEFMQLSVEIRCFSESSREIFARAYPLLVDKCSVVPHTVQFKPSRVPSVRGGRELHIGVVGGINYPKGRGVLESLIRYIEENNLNHKLSVVGETDIPVPGVNVTGRYEVDQLPDIIEKLGINAILIPSIWPETFSYVTSEMIALGLPIACFNLGAPAERVRIYARGIVLDTRDPEGILRGLSDIVSLPSVAIV